MEFIKCFILNTTPYVKPFSVVSKVILGDLREGFGEARCVLGWMLSGAKAIWWFTFIIFILKVKAIKVLNMQLFFFAFIPAWCTGKTQRDRVEMWERGLEWGTHVNPWLIHVNVWKKKKKTLRYCKIISLQPNVQFVCVRSHSVSKRKPYWVIFLVTPCLFLWFMFGNEVILIMFLNVSKYFWHSMYFLLCSVKTMEHWDVSFYRLLTL